MALGQLLWIPIFLVLFLLQANQCHANDELDLSAMGETIGRMEAELHKMRNGSENALKRLDALAKGGLQLMDLLGPIAKFALGAFFDAFLKPESAEQKAIMQLGKEMARGFKHLEVEFGRRFDRFECQQVGDIYDDTVVLKLKPLFHLFYEVFFGSTQNVSLAKEHFADFLAQCEKSKPFHILENFIDHKLRENCPLNNMDSGEVDCKHMPEGHDPRCYLKIYRDGNQHRREPFLAFVDQVESDMLKLAITGTFCLIHSDRPNVYKKEKLKDIGQRISTISAHMKMWSDKNLESAWPEITLKYAIHENGIKEETVEAAMEIGDNGPLNVIAESIAKEARARGPLGYDYQAHVWSKHVPLVARGIETKMYSAQCQDPHFCLKFEHAGLHILLYRYLDNENTAKFFDGEVKRWVEANCGGILEKLNSARSSSLAQLYDGFAEIGAYFGATILMDHIGMGHAHSEGQSSSKPSREQPQHVQHHSYQLEHREPFTSPVLSGHVQLKLLLIIGEAPLHFTRAVNAPKSVLIVGTPKAHKPRHFVVNFKCENGEILLHFDARFNFEWSQNVVIFNSWGQKSASENEKHPMEWFEEERPSLEFPFKAGQKFTLKFEMKPGSNGIGTPEAVEISINGHHFYTFVYRNPTASNHSNLDFQMLEIKGDLHLLEDDVQIE